MTARTPAPSPFGTACVVDYCKVGAVLAKQDIDTYYQQCLAQGVSNILHPFDMCGVLYGDDSSCRASLGSCSVLGDTGFITLVGQNVMYGGLGVYDLT